MNGKSYRVVCIAGDLTGFEEEVDRYLFEGWEEVGGISISHQSNGDIVFAQAVIFDIEENA